MLTKYAQQLRKTLDIGVLTAADSDAASWDAPGAGDSYAPVHYTIRIKQYYDQLHPAMPLTKLWGYSKSATPDEDVSGSGAPNRHLGPIIVASRGTPVQISFENILPPTHILPVDQSSFFFDSGMGMPLNKTAVHIHGGCVPWISDGGPFDWWAPGGSFGPSFMNHYLYPANQAVPGSQAPVPGWAEYYYPNQYETARLMWYHDHAHDITRLNAYAGIASGYLVTDGFEANLIAKGLVPPIVDLRHNPMIFQDKIFDLATGSLLYPSVYETPRWDLGLNPPNTPVPNPSCVPEMFGDTMLVNGTVCPTMTVDPRRYRFRILNACNARYMNLQLYVKGNTQDITYQTLPDLDPNQIPPANIQAPSNPVGPPFVQIGNEGGFLPAPVVLNSRPIGYNQTTGIPNRYTLVLSPAERADVVIDFSAFAGQRLILYSDAPAPYPGGDPLNDYFSDPAFSPNTRTVMEFVVNPRNGSNYDTEGFSSWLSRLSRELGSRIAELRAPSSAGALHRILTLNERYDDWGRLIQLVGNDTLQPGGGYGKQFIDAPSETPLAGATEIWELYNNTADTHPMHFHLVNVQILNRQPFSTFGVFTGPARGPDANERGWKETVRCNPGEVTRIIMRFDMAVMPAGFVTPTSPRAATLPGLLPGKKYHEYVYHCHILEHEEHDMMRPLIVQE